MYIDAALYQFSLVFVYIGTITVHPMRIISIKLSACVALVYKPGQLYTSGKMLYICLGVDSACGMVFYRKAVVVLPPTPIRSSLLIELFCIIFTYSLQRCFIWWTWALIPLHGISWKSFDYFTLAPIFTHH